MNIKRSISVCTAVILAFTVVPLGISGAGCALPAVSDKIVYSVARSISGNVTEKKPVQTDSILQNNHVNKTAWDLEAAPQELEIPLPKGSEIPTPLPSQEIIGAIPYANNPDDDDGVIEKTNFGTYSGEQYFDLDGFGQVRNCTQLDNETLIEGSKAGRSFDIEIGSEEPQVLIYHTHTTESYEIEDKPYYDSDFCAKTTEPDKNMTAVGNKICEQLEANGITVIHDTLVHDYPSYNGSYDSSRETVKELLEQYPSVKVALDIHRDGIETADGVRLAPVAEFDGKEAAQIMIISGCDDGTMGMPKFMDNFGFACELQSQTESMFGGLTRPILFDYRFYNQDLTTGSLLIEVGSHGNTLEQALYSGELIGKALSELFTGENA